MAYQIGVRVKAFLCNIEGSRVELYYNPPSRQEILQFQQWLIECGGDNQKMIPLPSRFGLEHIMGVKPGDLVFGSGMEAEMVVGDVIGIDANGAPVSGKEHPHYCRDWKLIFETNCYVLLSSLGNQLIGVSQ